MKPLAVAALALVAVAGGSACGREAETGCPAAATLAWSPIAGKVYRVAAVAAGRSCGAANVMLTVQGAGTAPLLTFTSAAADLPLVFAEATTPTAMAASLRRWIEQPAAGRTMRDLPPWSAAEEEPTAGAVLFQPEPAISRAHYAELRKWSQPAFCFLQGTNSEACYALDIKSDTLTLIGTRPSQRAAPDRRP